jgi:hypothetical protein
MRAAITFILGAVALAAAPAQAKTTPEEKLARAIEGRVPGEPVKCINLSRVQSSRVIDKTAIVYDVGSTVYVNRPRGGAEQLDSRDILITKTHSGDLCSLEVVQLYDSAARMPTGFVSLGEFVPYKRVKTASN